MRQPVSHTQRWTAILAPVLALGLAQPAASEQGRPQLRAVVVHGEILDEPLYFHEPEIIAGCLWSSTYNLHGVQTGPPPGPDAPAITFSFFLDSDLERYVDTPTGSLESLTPDIGMFHTRLLLTPVDGGSPAAMSRKARGMGPFRVGHPLDPLAENLLARLGIPTRLAPNGSAVTNHDTVFDLDRYRAWGECLALPDSERSAS